jgi:iron(III) transport system permease protein
MMTLSNKNKYFLLIISFGCFIACLYPYLRLAENTLTLNLEDKGLLFSLQRVLNNSLTKKAMLNTLLVSILTSIFSVVFATPLAWVLSRVDIKFSKTWTTLFSLPYAIPPFVGAIAWINLASPSSGLLSKVIGENVLDIYSLSGLVFVLTSFFYTYILLSLLGGLKNIDSSLEEAARLSGANGFKVFFDISLPLLWPNIKSSALLVFLASAASFGVPALIGSPGGIYLLTTRIYMFQKMGSLNGISAASLLSFFLIFLAILIVFIQQLLNKNNIGSVVQGKSSRISKMNLGKNQKLVQVILFSLFSILFLLPIMSITFSSLSKVQGVFSFSNLTFQNFSHLIFEMPEFLTSVKNSLYLSVTVATVSVAVGLVLSYIEVRTNIFGRTLVRSIPTIPFSTPGTVLALAILLSFGRRMGNISLYNTLFLIGIAYFVKYLSFAVRTISDGMRQIDSSLEESSVLCGATFFRRMVDLWFPILRSVIISAWFLIFMPCFSELTMTILLTGPGLETLGTLLFQLQEYGDSGGGGAASLCVLLIGFILMINFVIKKISKGSYGL